MPKLPTKAERMLIAVHQYHPSDRALCEFGPCVLAWEVAEEQAQLLEACKAARAMLDTIIAAAEMVVNDA